MAYTYYCQLKVNAARHKLTTANDEEAQIHAKLDGKKVVISEATIKRDLKFEDAEGIDCLSNKVIFEQLLLMGQDTQDTQPSGPTTNVEEKDFNAESAPTHSSDPLHSESSTEERFGKEDASKQERNIADIDIDKGTTLVNETAEDQRSLNDQDEIMFDDEKDLQALKTSKPKMIVVRDHKEPSESTTTPTSVADSTRPKARGVVMQDPSETTTTIPIPSKVQDKAKDMDTEVVGSSKKTVAAEGSSKRAGEEIEQESSKRQKVDDDQKAAELKKRWLQVDYEVEMAYDLLRLVRRQLRDGYVPE
nr:hypothetical protein [Tanacetum cinerariifolium]